MSDRKYQKMCKGNDWGNHYYNFKKDLYTAAGSADCNRGLHLHGKEIYIKFPSYEVKARVKIRKTIEHVSDMGHEYNVNTFDYVIQHPDGFEIDINGLMVSLE